ncbi:unnamed protein product [Orchesella dallaii]|uniref:Uncharacterized protein n=1 Tax=Orchesella dallaii TaxID=48710 RepID=A0ABP1RXZ2_9HEXA
MSRSRLFTLSHDVFFCMETHQVLDECHRFALIKSIKVPLVCNVQFSKSNVQAEDDPCNQRENSIEFSVESKLWRRGNLDEIYDSLYFVWQSLFKVSQRIDVTSFPELDFLKHVGMCHNLIEHGGFWANNLPFKTVQDKITHALVHVWMSVMGNFSYVLPNSDENIEYCANGVWKSGTTLEKNPFPTILMINDETSNMQDDSLLFQLPAPLTSLRFVSCGHPQLSGLAFVELVKIFDPEIWLYLLIFLVGSALASELIGLELESREKLFQGTIGKKLKNTMKKLFSLLKVLLEQGDDCLNSSASSWPLWIRWTFLAAALILSNAYKGQNVFNLVTTRRPIPYHYFSQLTKDGFNIYVRLLNPSMLVYDLDFPGIRIEAHSVNMMSGIAPGTAFIPLHVTADSEPRVLREKLKLASMHKVNISLSLENRLDNLLNNSRIIPTMLTVIKEVATEVYLPFFSNDSSIGMLTRMHTSPEKLWSIVSAAFSKWETKHQIEHLTLCNRTAIVLPAHMAHSMAINVTRGAGWKRDIYVGKDILYERKFLFNLRGFVKISFFMKIKWVGSSGIWEFWPKIFQTSAVYKEDASAYDLTKPTMAGNDMPVGPRNSDEGLQ